MKNKPLILVAVLMMGVLSLKAQPNMLNKTREYIKAFSYLPSGIGSFEKEGTQNDSTTYLEFVAKSDSTTHFRYYLNPHGICTLFVILHPVEDMASMVSFLNETYDRIKPDEWIGKNKDIHISLYYLKGQKTFTTSYRKL